jgi:hypothetical protein
MSGEEKKLGQHSPQLEPKPKMKTKRIKGQYRQGDILIEEVDCVPKEAIKQEHRGPVILALGEATGHHHCLEDDQADWWKLGEEQYVEPSAPAKPVAHQEHALIPLRDRPHKVTRQREYSPEAIRNVTD